MRVLPQFSTRFQSATPRFTGGCRFFALTEEVFLFLRPALLGASFEPNSQVEVGVIN
jgi:hypothetical protein